MAFDMMDSHQRFAGSEGDSLCRRNSHQKSSHQARTIGDRHGCRLLQGNSCVGKSLFDYLVDFFNMLSGCYFRDHAAVEGVQVDLGIYHIGKYFSAIADNGGCGFIAGAFHSKNIYIFFFHNAFTFYTADYNSQTVPGCYCCSSSKRRSILFPSFPTAAWGNILRTPSM